MGDSRLWPSFISWWLNTRLFYVLFLVKLNRNETLLFGCRWNFFSLRNFKKESWLKPVKRTLLHMMLMLCVSLCTTRESRYVIIWSYLSMCFYNYKERGNDLALSKSFKSLFNAAVYSVVWRWIAVVFLFPYICSARLHHKICGLSRNTENFSLVNLDF